jgi:hypothetical protein
VPLRPVHCPSWATTCRSQSTTLHHRQPRHRLVTITQPPMARYPIARPRRNDATDHNQSRAIAWPSAAHSCGLRDRSVPRHVGRTHTRPATITQHLHEGTEPNRQIILHPIHQMPGLNTYIP